MPLYDFIDEVGHTTEAVRGYGVASIPCPRCGADAPRKEFNLVSSVIREGGTRAKSAKGKYLVSDFQEASQELEHAAQRDGVQLPNFYEAAKSKLKE